MPQQHIVRSFDEELQYLEAKILDMGRHALVMIESSVAALVANDQNLAQKIIADDLYLDYAEREIDEKAIMVIAKRQPMAVDLRAIIGAIRVSSDLERIGDMGKNIAKRVRPIAVLRPSPLVFESLETLVQLACNQLKEVLDAYANRSLERIDAVRQRDNEIDATYSKLFRELLDSMISDKSTITPCTHLLFCAKNLERVGDHITNIAETLHYIITGNLMEAERPRDDKSYDVSLHE